MSAMRSRIIIHIGSHKTGTSFLQQHLHINSAELLANGFYYPELEEAPVEQHSSLAIALRAVDKSPALNALAKIREFADKHHAHTLLISGEAFSFATQDEVAFLKQGLGAPSDCEFRILLYLRNTHDYIRSVLNMHLRFEDYLVTEAELLSRLVIYQPDEIVRRWETVFGPENVHVFSYDKQKSHLLDHFIEAAGIPQLRPCALSKGAMNASIDFLCALMMNQLLFDRDMSVKWRVYSELTSKHEVWADYLYPAEATMIENIIKQAGIEVHHPKLLQIESYLTSVPDARSASRHEQTSIERVIATLQVIGSVLGCVQGDDSSIESASEEKDGKAQFINRTLGAWFSRRAPEKS